MPITEHTINDALKNCLPELEFGVGHALQDKFDCGSVEFLPVMEFDPLAQLEFPGGRVDRTPGDGEPGNEARIRIHVHQRIEHMRGGAVVGSEVHVMRVERGHVGGQVDDLLAQFRAYHKRQAAISLAELRRSYDMLLLKVLSLLQDSDPALAHDIVSSRAAIWGILEDPQKFNSTHLMAGDMQ